jgi:outer membrane murein-binding lipoprotein Lpp
MNKLMLVLVLLAGLGQSGCAFLGGAAIGALGTSAGYEINAKSKMDQLEDDYKAERISRAEYLSRKAQLEKGSIIY